MESPTLTQHERRTLLRFEALYAEWRKATDDWLAAEVLLWTEAFQRPGSPEFRRLAAEATDLRDAARAAYLRVMEALVHSLPD